MALTQYISDDEIAEMLDDCDLSSLEPSKKQSAVRLAVGNLESELNKRFIIPLRAKNGDYESAPEFTRMKIELAFRCSFQYVLGSKYMRNSDLSDLGTYTQDKYKEFISHIKSLLDFQNDYELKLKAIAQDAQEPLQSLGIAKANNNMSYDY